MALVLLTTASLAVVSMTFALGDGVKADLVPALAFGLLWGLVILNLDRFLVLSMGTTRDKAHLFGMAVPRFLMAAVLATVISTPLVLRVFHNDIRAEITTYQLEQSKHQKILEGQSKEQAQANALEKQINEQQAILDGHLPESVSSPGLQTATREVNALQHKSDAAQRAKDTAYEAYQCELYGASCHGASKRRGRGPLAGAKQREYNDALQKFEALQQQLNGAISRRQQEQARLGGKQSAALAQAQSQARSKLPGLRSDLAALQKRIEARSKGDSAANDADTGILAQIRALSRVGDRNSALRWTHRFVFALFFLIEILPVTVKILLSLGAPTAYDITASLKEEELKDTAKIHRNEATRVAEGKSQTRVDLEDDMRGREKAIGKQANTHVAGEMSSIVELALKEWSDKVRRDLRARQATPPPTNGSDPESGGASGKRSTPTGGSASAPAGDVDDAYRMPPVDDL